MDTPFGPPSASPPEALGTPDVNVIASIREHVAKGALSMVDWANHKPENRNQKPKVGGHQASSMSSVDLLVALYLGALERGDRVAVKPHAAPVLYALMHAMGLLPSAKMAMLREFGGPQPYPTELKNPRFVHYTTSSEALGVACTVYDAYGALHHNRGLGPRLGLPPMRTHYWAHCGDGELTEGQIDESLYDAGRWQLPNLTWIVDLNRQSLDRVMDDSGQLGAWAAQKFRGHGFDVRELRWGSRAEALFARRGGDALRGWLEGLDDAGFHVLLMLPDAVLAALLAGERAHPEARWARFLGDHADRYPMPEPTRQGVRALLGEVDAGAVKAGVGHLGGHDLAKLVETYRAARSAGRPVCIVAHTVKGYETSAAAHPENHGGLLPSDEVAAWGLDRGLPTGVQWPVPAAGTPEAALLAETSERLFPAALSEPTPPPVDVRSALAAVPFKPRTTVASGEIFQSLNLALLKTDLAPYLQFGAPDVGQTTHLGPIIKQTGVFAPRDLPDSLAWLRETGELAFDWRPSTGGQFHAFGIAEGNAMLWAYSFGRRPKPVEGRSPLLPVVTVYDKFFERGFNQLDYAVYSNARFIAVGVPSGTGLSRETATHQSIQTLRMMMDLPGLMTWEPAFAADLHVIYLHALGSLWDEKGEAHYLRLTTQRLDQPRDLPEDHARQAVAGGYWLVGEDVRAASPGKGTVLLVSSGRKLREVREAAALLQRDHGVGSRILNVTSFEALWRDWDAYANDPAAWDDPSRTYHLHELFAEDVLNLPLLIVGDFVPSVAEWLPTALQRVRGHRFLGPRRNGETGDLASVDALHGMGVDDVVRVALEELSWRSRHGLA
jgi:pyruvate dehydrogenase E1 component